MTCRPPQSRDHLEAGHRGIDEPPQQGSSLGAAPEMDRRLPMLQGQQARVPVLAPGPQGPAVGLACERVRVGPGAELPQILDQTPEPKDGPSVAVRPPPVAGGQGEVRQRLRHGPRGAGNVLLILVAQAPGEVA